MHHKAQVLLLSEFTEQQIIVCSIVGAVYRAITGGSVIMTEYNGAWFCAHLQKLGGRICMSAQRARCCVVAGQLDAQVGLHKQCDALQYCQCSVLHDSSCSYAQDSWGHMYVEKPPRKPVPLYEGAACCCRQLDVPAHQFKPQVEPGDPSRLQLLSPQMGGNV